MGIRKSEIVTKTQFSQENCKELKSGLLSFLNQKKNKSAKSKIKKRQTTT